MFLDLRILAENFWVFVSGFNHKNLSYDIPVSVKKYLIVCKKAYVLW